MALVLKTDGSIVPLGINPTFKEMQNAVGGYIECVRIFDGRHMYVNDDGKAMNLPPNAKASQMAGIPIVGDAVLLDGQETMEDLNSKGEAIVIDPLSSSILTIPLEKTDADSVAKALAEDSNSVNEVVIIDPLSATSVSVPLNEEGATDFIAKTLAGALGANILQEEEE